jgi:hypothetical protein
LTLLSSFCFRTEMLDLVRFESSRSCLSASQRTVFVTESDSLRGGYSSSPSFVRQELSQFDLRRLFSNFLSQFPVALSSSPSGLRGAAFLVRLGRLVKSDSRLRLLLSLRPAAAMRLRIAMPWTSWT